MGSMFSSSSNECNCSTNLSIKDLIASGAAHTMPPIRGRVRVRVRVRVQVRVRVTVQVRVDTSVSSSIVKLGVN